MKTTLPLFFFFILSCFSVAGQSEISDLRTSVVVEIVEWMVEEKQLLIYYDLSDSGPDREYDLKLNIEIAGKKITPKKGISGLYHIGTGRHKIIWWFTFDGYASKDFKDKNLVINLYPFNINSTVKPVVSRASLWADLEIRPSLAALNLTKGQSEIKWLNTFGRDREFFNFNTNSFQPYSTYHLPKEESPLKIYTSTINFLRGLTENGQFSAGIDLSYQRTALDTFKLRRTMIGPRISWRPFKHLGTNTDLIIGNSLLFQIGSNADSLQAMTSTRFSNQLTLTHFIRPRNLILLANTGISFLPKSKTDDYEVKNPISISSTFLIAYYPKRTTLFSVGLTYSSIQGNVPWSNNNSRYRRNSSTDLNLGAQWTYLNQYSFICGYSFELANRFGGQSSFLYMGVRVLL